MRYISLFSGIEAASVAWEPLGLEPVAFCEIDEFPSAVLAHHYPDVPNLGDITKVDWKEVIEEHGAVDLIVGGSPCQSFSVAGGRESLRGESRLMFEYIRALREVRPRWFLWENVPGVLNTRDDAFAQLLGEVQDIGYGSVAWRVLDAQFFGVAQRRRRVFLVGHLGDGGGAAAVLFESESVRGNTQTSREKREALARAAGRGASARGESVDVVAFKYSAGAAARTMPTYSDGSCNTLTADYHSPAVALDIDYKQTPKVNEEICHTLTRGGDGGIEGHMPESYVLKVRGGADTYIKRDGRVGTAGKGALVEREVTYTLAASQDQTILTDVGGTSDDMAVTIHDGSKWVVRRLTPVECERLQGFPDGWTDIPYRGKEHPTDTPRYKALGNSMAVPTMRWLGDRLQMVQEIMDEKES